MKLSEWPRAVLADRLSHRGLDLRTGPFLYHINSDVEAIVDGLQSLYGDFTVDDGIPFADYHVQLSRQGNWRRFGWEVAVKVGGNSPASPLPLDQAFAVFEGCLNWCIYAHAHQYLIVHAATVEKAGNAIVLPALPGSGKSTLCAALISRGWRLLTDELTLIDVDSCAIIPLARPVSLKNESIQVIRQFAAAPVFGPISLNTIKGTVAHMRPPAESIERVDESCRARWLITPQYTAGSETLVSSMSKGRAFMSMAGSSVNYMMHGARGFAVLSEMVDHIDAFGLVYSDLHDVVRWFDKLGVG